MILTLLAVSLNDQALTRPITARFDNAGGTIGRADHSTMALPDPERFISRKQAEIAFVGGGFTIRNVGAANPITVAQRTLAAGEAAPLRHGDEVRIGGYLLRAECRLGETSRGTGEDVAATVVSGALARPAARPVSPPLQATAMPAQAAVKPRAAGLAAQAARPAPVAPAAPRRPAAPEPPAGAALGGSAPLSSDNPFADLLGPAAGPAAGLTDLSDFAAPRAGSSPAAPAALPDDPFAGLMPGPAGLDPALGGLGRTTPSSPSSRAAAGAPALLPDDFDPFAPPAAPSGPASTPARAAGAFDVPGPAPLVSDADPFADLLGRDAAAGGSASIDQAFGLGSADAGADALARFVADAGSPAPGRGAPGGSAPGTGTAGGLSTDPLMLFGDDSSPSPGASPAAGGPFDALADPLPAVHGAYTPPKVSSKAAVPASPGRPATPVAAPISASVPAPVAAPAAAPLPKPTPPPAPAPPRAAAAPRAARPPAASAPRPAAPAAPAAPLTLGAADTAALWQAFCEGAGIDLPVPAGEGEALMRHVGRVLRSAVEGTLQLIAVRASTKHEMRAAITQIKSTSNNPLKFSPDALSGLEQLLSPPQRGFMDGASAMDDAMLDLVGHSIGTVAGMRAAIEGMLARFDPAALEEKLGAGSRLSNLLPASRKARLWELYLQHHRQIRDEAEEDFHTLFGRAFVAAYEEQVDRLEREQRQRQRAARR